MRGVQNERKTGVDSEKNIREKKEREREEDERER